jgi:hypothetical protein
VAGTGMAGVAADPGERAACAKSNEKRVVTVGGSLPVYPNRRTRCRPPLRKSAQKQLPTAGAYRLRWITH